MQKFDACVSNPLDNDHETGRKRKETPKTMGYPIEAVTRFVQGDARFAQFWLGTHVHISWEARHRASTIL